MPGRDNYIYRQGATPNTRMLNIQRVKLFSFDAEDQGKEAQIGLVQGWNPTHSRTIEPHRGIGFGDQIAEQGVGVTDLTATLSVMMMYLRDIMQVLGYKAGSSGFIRSLKHHRWPFDVKEEISIPDFISSEASVTQTGEDGGSALITIYEGCWMSEYSKAFTIGDTASVQDTTIMITDVYADPTNSRGNFDDATTSNDAISALFGTQRFT